MKAIAVYIYVIIVCLIVLVISLVLINLSIQAFNAKSLDQLRRFQTYRPYTFNVNNLVVDSSSSSVFSMSNQTDYYTSTSDPPFCKDLRNCIQTSLMGGNMCEISYKVKNGTTFNPQDVKNAIQNCPPADIKEEVFLGTGRKVCKFKSITKYNSMSEDNVSLINYEPYIHDCYIPVELGTLNVLNDNDSINYLYSGRGNENGYSFDNGGTVRMVVTNVSVDNNPYATCSYSIYVCGQNAIAANEQETPVQIFKKIQYLDGNELYYNASIVWKGTSEVDTVDATCHSICSFLASITPPLSFLGPNWQKAFCNLVCGKLNPVTPGYNVYGYNPRPYDFNFSGSCQARGTCDKALIDTIDAGMWEWNKINYVNKVSMKYFMDAYYPDINYIYFSYSPIPLSNINPDPNIDYSSGCWNVSYEDSNIVDRTNLNFGDKVFSDSQSLMHNYKFSSPFDANKEIKMVLGIKKIFITNKKYHLVAHLPILGDIDLGVRTVLNEVNSNFNPPKNLEPRVILVLDPITFCSD